MNITFYGAAQNVTGSKHLIETDDGFKLLLDCGFHQGKREEAEYLNRHFPLDAQSIDAAILSHAHLDHCGMLPVLVRNGYRGPIYATPATIEVTRYMLEDSADIQEHDTAYLNRHLRAGQKPVSPIYTHDDIAPVMDCFEEAAYHSASASWHRITEHIRFKLYDAGHILGSAMVVIEVTERLKKVMLAFTGDVGKKNAPLLRDPQYVDESIDAMIMESTYGDRVHQPFEEAGGLIIDAVERAIAQKGKIIIPAFALGRTQELLYMMHHLRKQGRMKNIPVYLDSPLAVDLTHVFMKHRALYDDQTWQDFDPAHDVPLLFERLTMIRSREESVALNTRRGPVMIISGSGMMEGGRIRHHLKHTIEDPTTTILITGYQAEHTLGRKIQDGVTPVHILNRSFTPRASVISIPALSAHADQDGLCELVDTTKGLKTLFLVHGEKHSMDELARVVRKRHRDVDVRMPERGERCELTSDQTTRRSRLAEHERTSWRR